MMLSRRFKGAFNLSLDRIKDKTITARSPKYRNASAIKNAMIGWTYWSMT